MPHFWNWRSPYGIQHSFVNVSGKEHSNNHSRHDKENSETIADEVDKARKKLEQEFQNETIQEMIHNIIDFIPKCHLKREFYPNKPGWSNEEINNLISYSPADIENRSWVFYMNPCISQTLYTINKLKEEFPDLKDHINLWIEFLEFENNGIQSAHAFIEIDAPEWNKIIIDYARSNDVYIYQWDYKNNTVGVKSKKINPIPSKIFDKSDNIFNIAKEAWFNEESILEIKNNLSILLKHLCNENNWNSEHTGEEKYKKWEKEHGNSPIFCLENWKDEKWDTEWLKFKIENWNKKKILIENWKNDDWSIIWSELKVENEDPLKIYIIDNDWNKEYIKTELEKNIQNLILYCK